MHSTQPMTHKQQNTMGMVLLAAAAGALAGMLFAPKRGTEMREDLRGKYNDMMDKAQDSVDAARDKMSQGVEKARSKVHDTADKTKDMADKAADKAEDTAADVSSRRRTPGSPTL